MAVEQFFQYLPPEVIYRRVPLPDDQNALGLLREAVEHYVAPEENDEVWDAAGGIDPETDEPIPFPTGDERRHVCEIIEKNSTALELLDSGIVRGRLQLPGDRWFDGAADSEWMFKLRDLMRVRRRKVLALIAEGDLAGAVHETILSMSLGEMMCNGEATVCDYLLGHGYRKAALLNVHAILAAPEISRESLEELLRAVQRGLTSPDGLARSMRAELCTYALVHLDRLTEDDLPGMIEQVLPDPPKYLLDDDLMVSYEVARDRAVQRRKQFLSLLEDHPRPLDKAATARMLGEETAWMIRNIHTRDNPSFFNPLGQLRRLRRYLHSRRRARRARIWPQQFYCSFNLYFKETDLENEAADTTQMKEELDAETLAFQQEYSRPLTDAELANIRERLCRIDNPFGILLFEFLGVTDLGRPFMQEYRDNLKSLEKYLLQQLRRCSPPAGATV